MVNSIILNTALLICTQFLDVDTHQCSGIKCELRKQNCVTKVARCLKDEHIEKCFNETIG